MGTIRYYGRNSVEVKRRDELKAAAVDALKEALPAKVPSKIINRRAVAPHKVVSGEKAKIRPMYALSTRDQLSRDPIGLMKRFNAWLELVRKTDDVLTLNGLANAFNCSIDLIKNIENTELPDGVKMVVINARQRIFEYIEKCGYKLTNPAFPMFTLESQAGWSKKVDIKKTEVKIDLLKMLEMSATPGTGDSAKRIKVEGVVSNSRDISEPAITEAPSAPR